MDEFRDIEKLEGELARLRPEPGFEFLCRVEALIGEPAPRAPRARPAPRWRVAAVGAVTLSLAAGLAATGGLSYAASSVRGVVKVAHRAAKPQQAVVVRGLSAGGDQYKPGFGFGDENHNHDGPPGLSRQEVTGSSADSGTIPAAPTRDAQAKVVATAVTFDEQVHLYISVIDPKNTPLLLTQKSKRGGSTVGNGLNGPQTKFIQYAVLVPRTIPMRLRVPSNLLEPNVKYRIRIVAIDPQGNRTQLLIPFRA
jgi:hypothetical protein